jgi:hypothetical protein
MTKNQSWEVSYKALVAYKREHGHCHVHKSENAKLVEWVRAQRRRFSQVGKRRKLTNDELDRLNAINFPWDGRQSLHSLQWDGMLNELLDYKREHGDCYVPLRYKGNIKLGAWVVIQRGRNRAKLTEDQVKRLNAAGFQWESKADRDDRVWREKLERLMTYKRKHGNCIVPYHYEEDPSLGSWVRLQRKLGRKNTLLSERRDKLDAVGFVWVVNLSYESLDRWVRQQRMALLEGSIEEDRKRALDEINFGLEG